MNAQRRHGKAFGRGRAADGKAAEYLVDAQCNIFDLVERRDEFSLTVQAPAAKLDRFCAAIDNNGAALGEQKNRDADQHEIHQWEIPQGAGRSDEAAPHAALVESAR